MRERGAAHLVGERRIAVHLAVDLEFGRTRLDQRQRLAHFHRGGPVAGAEARMRQQRRLGRDAEAAYFLRREHRHLGHLLRRGIEIDVGVADEHRALGQQEHVHRVVVLHPRPQADHLVDIVQMQGMCAEGAAEHAVGRAAVHHHGADEREPPAHLDLGIMLRHAAALGEPVVFLPILAVARVFLRIDEIEIRAGLDAQTEALQAPLDHRRPADQDRPRQPLVHDHLGGAQDTLVLALGQHDAVFLRHLGRGEHRLHQQARVIDEFAQLLHIQVEVGDRARGYARVHCRLGHRRRDLDDQARIEGCGDEVFRPEGDVLLAIGGGDDVGLLGHGEVGDGMHAGEFHRLVDGGRAHVERAAENEGEAEDVVHLVRKVRAAGGDDRVGPGGLGQVGLDFRLRIGEREDQRLVRHLLHHLWLQHLARRQAEEHVGAGDDVAQGARIGLLRIARLVRVHLLLASCVHHALDVGDPDVFHR